MAISMPGIVISYKRNGDLQTTDRCWKSLRNTHSILPMYPKYKITKYSNIPVIVDKITE